MIVLLLTAGGRSGSHMLCGMLNSHPDITCEHEYVTDDWRATDFGTPVSIIHNHWHTIEPDMLTADVPRMALTRWAWAGSGKTQDMIARLGWPHNPKHAETLIRARKIRTERLVAHADFVIDYDDITGGEEVTELGEPYRTEVCNFLGVPARPMPTTARKKNPHA